MGCVRLVRPAAEQVFPIQRNCNLTVASADLPAPNTAAEISRMWVQNDHWRHRGDRLSGVTAEQNTAAFAGERRHEAAQILVGLYRQICAYRRDNAIDYCYAAMELPLAQSIGRMRFAPGLLGPRLTTAARWRFVSPTCVNCNPR